MMSIYNDKIFLYFFSILDLEKTFFLISSDYDSYDQFMWTRIKRFLILTAH